MHRIIFITLLFLSQLLYSQSRLDYTLAVYPQHKQSRDVARMLSVGEDWTKIGVLNTLLWQGQKLSHWRVAAVLHGLKTNREVTLQLGLRTPDNQFISFNFPKKQENEAQSQKIFSNWFLQKKRGLHKKLLQEPIHAYVRLLGDAQTQAFVNIKTLTLECWQDDTTDLKDTADVEQTREEARYVAIDFFDFLLENREVYFPKVIPLYNLDTGELIHSTKWQHLMISEHVHRSEYRYRFYDYQQMRHSFPELFAAERSWTPPLTSFLFVAYTPRRKMTKFIIEKKSETWQLAGLSSANIFEETPPKLKKNELKVASHVPQNFLAYHPHTPNDE